MKKSILSILILVLVLLLTVPVKAQSIKYSTIPEVKTFGMFILYNYSSKYTIDLENLEAYLKNAYATTGPPQKITTIALTDRKMGNFTVFGFDTVIITTKGGGEAICRQIVHIFGPPTPPGCKTNISVCQRYNVVKFKSKPAG